MKVRQQALMKEVEIFLKGNLGKRDSWSWEYDQEWVRLTTELATAQIPSTGLFPKLQSFSKHVLDFFHITFQTAQSFI